MLNATGNFESHSLRGYVSGVKQDPWKLITNRNVFCLRVHSRRSRSDCFTEDATCIYRQVYDAVCQHLRLCVCVWTFSIEVKLVRFLLQGGQGHYVKPGPTKPDIMVDATWDAELCTCNFMDMMKVMFKHWS